MNDRLRYVAVSVLVLLFFLTEYVWIPWADLKIYIKVPFIYEDGPVRLDSYIYNASVKVAHFIAPLILFLLTPFKKECKYMMIAFGLAFFEFFLTWNMPVAQIPLPFNWFIPISTSPLKFASVCYFMWAAIKKAFE